MKKSVLWSAAALLALGTVTAQARNPIKNGSFETPKVPDGSYETFSTGDGFADWSVVGATGNIAIVSGDFTYCSHTFPAKKGKQWVDLTGTSDTAGTGLQQTINTTPGSSYELSFYIGNVYDTSSNCGTSSTVSVQIDGTTVGTFTNSAGKNKTSIVWKKYSVKFVAKNATTVVALFNEDPSTDTSNGLDAVSVTLAGTR